jgi:hypothetical protein
MGIRRERGLGVNESVMPKGVQHEEGKQRAIYTAAVNESAIRKAAA